MTDTNYSLSGIAIFIEKYDYGEPEKHLGSQLALLRKKMVKQQYHYIITSLVRFAFLIELTNLKITSTKLKTKWVPGDIIKTREDSYENYRFTFKPGNDPRSSTYDDCYDVFSFCVDSLCGSTNHLQVSIQLAKRECRSCAYENVFTYISATEVIVHTKDNIQLSSLDDIKWLINVRPILHAVISDKNKGKIAVKSYKTDRAQTGGDQSNRAKRWEILPEDVQFASPENCWSVERKLLTDIACFAGFPEKTKTKMVAAGYVQNGDVPECPVTLLPLNFDDFLTPSEHGKSKFQVGHLDPLKSGGNHTGTNIAWLSIDGNRMQGDMKIDEIRKLIGQIYERMQKKGLI